MIKPILSLLRISLRLISPTLLIASSGASALSAEKLKELNLPEGFKISIYAEVPNARQMTLGGKGNIYVGTRRLGKVFG